MLCPELPGPAFRLLTLPPGLAATAVLSAVRRFAPTWLALVAAAVVVDLAMVATYVHLSPGEASQSLAPSFPLSYTNWVMWAAFAPAVVAVVHTPLARRWSWGRRLAATLALSLALPAAHALVEAQLHGVMGGQMPAHARSFVSYHLFHGLLTFCALYAVALLIEAERVGRARAVREAQLQEQVTRAQLDTLRMQLQPHFLFNTLNSASALVEDDVRGGQRMIARLSEFLRATLSTAAHQEVPLREELRLLDVYVEIERVRFGDRLRVEYDVTDEARDALVPNLILQPLVENAIRHGVQPAVEGGTVTVRAFRDGACLVLEVADDGVGLGRGPVRSGTGVGLANTGARLRQCYGAAARLEVARREPRGTAVVQRLPFAAAATVRGRAAPFVAGAS
jgi:hypothetical protein